MEKTCIQFVPHPERGVKVRFMRPEFVVDENGNQIFESTACVSPVGYYNREQPLVIGTGCNPIGTVIHELLHALGMIHTMQRADRDSYVDIHHDNVLEGMEGNFVLVCLPYTAVIVFSRTTVRLL